MFRTLRNPDFRRLVVAQLVSVSGNHAHYLAVALIVYDRTESAALVGVALTLSQVPILLLAPVVGPVIDRSDVRRLLCVTQLMGGAVAVLLAVAAATDFHVVGAAMVSGAALGIIGAFDTPSRLTLSRLLVSDEESKAAMALFMGATTLARVVGPLVAAVLLLFGDTTWPIAANAASFAVAAVLAIRIAPILGRRTQTAPRGASAEDSVRALVRGNRTIATTLLLVLGVVMLAFNAQLIVLPLVEDRFDASSVTYTALVGVMGVGTLVGALLPGTAHPLGRVTLNPLVVVLGVAMIAAGATAWLVPLFLLILLAGAAAGAFTTVSLQRLQAATPVELTGRVMTLYNGALRGANPIGALVAGVAADLVGAGTAFVVLGAAVLAVAAAYALSEASHSGAEIVPTVGS